MENEIEELEHAECEFNVFLLNELVQKIQLLHLMFKEMLENIYALKRKGSSGKSQAPSSSASSRWQSYRG